MPYRRLGLFVLISLILVAIYWPTFQTIPNGSSDLKMIDVGETQVVLNTWGTLHPTGYPHYIIIGNLLVTAMKTIGISAVTAPAVVSLLWGLAALGLLYLLIDHLTDKTWLAALVTFIFGLTRFVWIHNVIAEIYSMALFLLIILYVIALWKRPIPYRISLLALMGGIGAAHHRGIGLAAPALIYAVWPQLWPTIRQYPLRIVGWLLLGLLGFLPYIYLPIRANAGAAWVYGEPTSWDGFWKQFTAQEAHYLSGWPDSFEQFHNNFNTVNNLLVTELSAWVIMIGLAGLLIAIYTIRHRRAALMLLFSALPAYIFSTVLYYDILATLILMITLTIVMGVFFLIDILLNTPNIQQYLTVPRNQSVTLTTIGLIAILYAGWLHTQNADWIQERTHDETGLKTIAQAENVPPGSTLMLAWGPRHFAVGFARDVEGRLQHIQLVDHNANFTHLITEGPLITPEYTLWSQNIDWWQSHLESPIYLRGIAPYLVQIDTAPERLPPTDWPAPTDETLPIAIWDYAIRCQGDFTSLYVDWLALDTPLRDMSVFVHLLDANDTVIGNADQTAPVYGWRPLSTWQLGEIVRDVYPLPDTTATQIKFGLYEFDGEFINYLETTLPLVCE